MKTIFRALAPLALAFLIACGGQQTKTTPTTPGAQQPLDPQGNWLFTFTGANGSLVFAGQLYELNPPVVTSNGMWGANVNCVGGGSLFANGQASGVSDITLAVTQQIPGHPELPTAAYSLTGTIADDQAHMSGAWTSTATNGCTVDTNGTWGAQLLPPFSGNYAGQLSNDDPVNANVTENVDQTSANMGALTGSLPVQSSCFSTGTVTIDSTLSTHAGTNAYLVTLPDTAGVTMSASGTLSLDGKTFSASSVSFTGGACAGRGLQLTLFKQ